MNSRKKFKPLDPDVQIKRLGERIRQLRKEKGYTSAETFANDHGFSRALYGRYEMGRNIEFTTLIKLVNSFEITLKEFINDQFDE